MKVQNLNIMTKAAIECELARAREKFPGNDYTFTALVEEVGEAARAILKYQQEGEKLYNVRAELVQVITMAIRVLEEGDASLNLPPSLNAF